MPKLFRTILVPYDFSPQAGHALKAAAELASSPRGRLIVLHVLTPYPVTGLTPAEMPYIPPVDVSARVKQNLESAVKRVVRKGGPRTVCQVVLGDPADRIVAAARNADSIVMSTQGRTGLAHLLIGSVAEKVVRHSPRPVLTLRAGVAAKRASRGRKRVARRR
jgi:nucleotide-binding universal stress UspA family protein